MFVFSCLAGIFLSLMIITSIVGNALVCIAVATERSLRRIGNLFIVSLAIADMFVACLVMTFAGVNDLLGYWVFGEQFCDTWIAFDVMCSTVSYLCIVHMIAKYLQYNSSVFNSHTHVPAFITNWACPLIANDIFTGCCSSLRKTVLKSWCSVFGMFLGRERKWKWMRVM